MLQPYIQFLKAHHFDAVVAEHRRLLQTFDAPLLKRLAALPSFDLARELQAYWRELLEAWGQGAGMSHTVQQLRQWSRDMLPPLPPGTFAAHDVLWVYSAQKQALLSCIEAYSGEPHTILALTREIEAHYTAVQAEVFTLVVELGHARVVEEARQEAAEQYAGQLARLSRELQLEVDRKRAIIDASLDAVVTIDGENRVLDFNPAAEAMFGISREAILQRDMTEVLIPPRYREAHRRGMAHYFATGEGPALRKRVELPALRRDGSEFPAEFVIIDLALPGQVAFTSFIRDLTEQKQAEEATRQLEAMKQADVLKDEFLSILSHELRTPINALMGFGSVIADEVAGPLTAAQERYIAKMLASADTLLALVNDLLDMSRIQAGSFALHTEPLAFTHVARDVIEMLRPLAEQKRHALVNAVDDALPPLQADRQRVGQVLTNLVNNAIKFTPDGGTITVRARLEGDRVRCEVTDTGPGIAAADMPRLFQRFSQLSTGNARTATGTGLGLSITKALVEAHGGEVGVTSTPGAGSTFWFSLPLQDKLTAGPAIL